MEQQESMTPLFAAKAGPNGMPEMTDREAARYAKYCRRFKEGQLLQVPAPRKPKKTISDPLRKYYFKVAMKIMSDYTGHTKEECHFAMKERFASERDDSGMLIPKSVFSDQSTLGIEEKQKFIEDVKRFAAVELGLYIPDPNEVEP